MLWEKNQRGGSSPWRKNRCGGEKAVAENRHGDKIALAEKSLWRKKIAVAVKKWRCGEAEHGEKNISAMAIYIPALEQSPINSPEHVSLQSPFVAYSKPFLHILLHSFIVSTPEKCPELRQS